jgi:hypothetical protein
MFKVLFVKYVVNARVNSKSFEIPAHFYVHHAVTRSSFLISGLCLPCTELRKGSFPPLQNTLPLSYLRASPCFKRWDFCNIWSCLCFSRVLFPSLPAHRTFHQRERALELERALNPSHHRKIGRLRFHKTRCESGSWKIINFVLLMNCYVVLHKAVKGCCFYKGFVGESVLYPGQAPYSWRA